MNVVVQTIELHDDAEKVQSAVDKFSTETNIPTDNIEAMLSEHMRTPTLTLMLRNNMRTMRFLNVSRRGIYTCR